jgi:hypothetical protein
MAILYATDTALAAVPAAGQPATITAPSVAGRTYFLMGIFASYDTSAGVGEFRIDVDGTPRFRHMVQGRSEMIFPNPIQMPTGAALTFTLAGAASRVPRLTLLYGKTDPQG